MLHFKPKPQHSFIFEILYCFYYDLKFTTGSFLNEIISLLYKMNYFLLIYFYLFYREKKNLSLNLKFISVI